MNKSLTISVVALLFGGLILVRVFEGDLFYDPLLQFFKVNHSTSNLPSFNTFRLMMHTAFRFLINTSISLLIIWVLFKKRDIIKVSVGLYAILFLVLFMTFFLLIHSSEAGGHMALFYVRRFLIQPIFLLLLIPAFYFHRKA